MGIVVRRVPGFEGPAIIEPSVRRDERGWFFEVAKASDLQAAGLPSRIVQENHSSSAKGVVRGLHYQLPPREQGKFVRCTRGAVFDVAIDLRRRSSTFATAFSVRLDATKPTIVWIPPGFAHGFQALEEDSELVYLCTEEYAPNHERCIRWSDPALKIAWPLPCGPMAPKDAGAPLLADAELP